MSRNDNRIKRTNAEKIYRELLSSRGLKKVKQYTTPIFNTLDAKKRGSLDRIRHVWTIGDRLYKLASEYYGDPEMWWLIAWYNQKPTESHYNLGDTVLIPLPIEDAITMFYEQEG
tara:strand:+ start:780 stop:1124 length:345 start_codon:yes stop_codon:yes gene_type:complete